MKDDSLESPTHFKLEDQGPDITGPRYPKWTAWKRRKGDAKRKDPTSRRGEERNPGNDRSRRRKKRENDSHRWMCDLKRVLSKRDVESVSRQIPAWSWGILKSGGSSEKQDAQERRQEGWQQTRNTSTSDFGTGKKRKGFPTQWKTGQDGL